MGKVDFLSNEVRLDFPADRVYSFLADLNNLQHLMPEQVINWQSTESSCSFDIKGMAHINLLRDELIPEKLIRVISGEDNPIDIEIRCHMEKGGPESTSARVEISADLSPMLKMLASGPLQNLVNIMADRLGKLSF